MRLRSSHVILPDLRSHSCDCCNNAATGLLLRATKVQLRDNSPKVNLPQFTLNCLSQLGNIGRTAWERDAARPISHARSGKDNLRRRTVWFAPGPPAPPVQLMSHTREPFVDQDLSFYATVLRTSVPRLRLQSSNCQP